MTKAFYALLLSVTILITGIFFSPDLQKMMMNRFHWRDSSFVRWSLLQFVPSMYNFSNRIEITPGASSKQVNHFPIRMITFNTTTRQLLYENGGNYRVTLSSSYHDTNLVTVYDLETQTPHLLLKYGP
jgi:hypothetical protein